MRYSAPKLISGNLSCTPALVRPAASKLSLARSIATGPTSETAQLQDPSPQAVRGPSSADLGIENTDITTAPGVELSDQQKVVLGSVLDLFTGRPSLKKLQLWTDDATFEDPLTKAEGRRQYEPQWYGLQSAFSGIERLSHTVTSSGNPMTMDLSTKYTVRGISRTQVINSVVRIHTDPQSGRITRLEDRWNDRLPEGAIAKASWFQLGSPAWWARYALAWGWWSWSFVWWTWPWLAFRKLNSVAVPVFVSVPKNEEEDQKRGN